PGPRSLASISPLPSPATPITRPAASPADTPPCPSPIVPLLRPHGPRHLGVRIVPVWRGAVHRRPGAREGRNVGGWESVGESGGDMGVGQKRRAVLRPAPHAPPPFPYCSILTRTIMYPSFTSTPVIW